MSNTEPKLTKKDTKGAAEEPVPAGELGLGGYIFGGGLGLLLVFVVLLGIQEPPQAFKATELPHLVVLAEFADLADPAVRSDLARLQRELGKLSDPAPEILGPATASVLLPSPGGRSPAGKHLDELTPEEFQSVLPYLKASRWWTPRLLGAELTSACLRVGPSRGNRFPAGARAQLEQILASFAGSSLKLMAYSHDLGFQDTAARERINAEFGVQTASAVASLPAGQSFLADPDLLFSLQRSANALQHPSLRSRVTLAEYWRYVLAVRSGNPNYEIGTLSPSDAEFLKLTTALGGPASMADAKGERALVFVTTTAEDAENLDVAHYFAANTRVSGFTLHAQRPR